MLVALGATCTSAISNPAPPLDADCANAGVKPIAVSAAQASITLDIVWKYRTLRAQRKPRGGFAALLVSTNRIDAVALESEFFWAPKRYSFEPNRPKPPTFLRLLSTRRFPVRKRLGSQTIPSSEFSPTFPVNYGAAFAGADEPNCAAQSSWICSWMLPGRTQRQASLTLSV